MGGNDNDWQLTFSNCQDNILVKPNIDIRIISNILIMISPLGSTYASEKLIILKELEQIQQFCNQHSTDHYMLTPEELISWVSSLTVQPSRYILHLITKIFDNL